MLLSDQRFALLSWAILCCLLIRLDLSVRGADALVAKRCPPDIEAYFKQRFPEWDPAGGDRRRLSSQQDSTTATFSDDLSSGLQGVFPGPRRRSRGPRVGASGERASTPSEATDRLKPKFPSVVEDYSSDVLRVPRDFYQASPNAYREALALWSGCASCEDGCCDETDIELTCLQPSTSKTYSPRSASNFTGMIYRVRIKSSLSSVLESKRTNLWVLQGGPGGSGLSLLGFGVQSLLFATDVYIPDHRGTGRSAKVQCPTETDPESEGGTSVVPEEVSACAQYSNRQGLPFSIYTVTNAAEDLAAWINEVKAATPGYPTYIHAYSYGTRWATRLLGLYPSIADKVVLEGNVPIATYFDDYAASNQVAGDLFMQKCSINTACAKQFPDALTFKSFVDALVADGGDNPCTTFLLGSETRITADSIAMGMRLILNRGLILGMAGPYASNASDPNSLTNYVDYRTWSLAVLSRWRRCGLATVDAEAHYRVFLAGMTWMFSLSGGYAGNVASLGETPKPATKVTEDDLDNRILHNIVAYGELRRYPFPYANAAAFAEAMKGIFWGRFGSYQGDLLEFETWKGYRITNDPLVDAVPTLVSGDVLIINGELDGQTPHYEARQQFREYFSVKSKFLAIIREAGHHASFGGCGLDTVMAFYHKTAPASCAVDSLPNPPVDPPIRPLSTGFRIPPRYSQQLLGLDSSDVFEGKLVPGFCTQSEGVRNTPTGCVRCFDYCIFTAETVSDACKCAETFASCLFTASSGDAQLARAVCQDYSARYDDFGIDVFTAPSGTCYRARSCSSTPSSTGSGSDVSGGAIAGIVIGIIVFLLLCVCIYLMCCTKGKGAAKEAPPAAANDPEQPAAPQQPAAAAQPAATTSAASAAPRSAGVARKTSAFASRGVPAHVSSKPSLPGSGAGTLALN